MIAADLRGDGLLWLINRTVFHPRGFALAFDPETCEFGLMGDGSEPWRFSSEADCIAAGVDPENAVNEDEVFALVERLFERARKENPR